MQMCEMVCNGERCHEVMTLKAGLLMGVLRAVFSVGEGRRTL